MGDRTSDIGRTRFASGSDLFANALAEILQPDTYVAIDVTMVDFVQPTGCLGFKIFIPDNFAGGSIVATPFRGLAPVTFVDGAYTKGAYLREARFVSVQIATATKTGLEAWY